MAASLALFLGSSLGAGVNLYLTLLAVGLYARFGEAVPAVQAWIEPFGSWWVIVPAAVLFVVEFGADKIPGLDNLWDGLHTLVRPVGAIIIALTLTRDTETAVQVLAALGGGTLALGSHGAKATLRATARLNPEPVTNTLSSSALSLIEDLSVGTLIVLAFVAPVVALVIAGLAILVIVWLARRIVRVLFRGRRQAA